MSHWIKSIFVFECEWESGKRGRKSFRPSSSLSLPLFFKYQIVHWNDWAHECKEDGIFYIAEYVTFYGRGVNTVSQRLYWHFEALFLVLLEVNRFGGLTARLGSLRYFLWIHWTVQFKLGLKISDQKHKNVTQGGGRKRAKKVSRIIWITHSNDFGKLNLLMIIKLALANICYCPSYLKIWSSSRYINLNPWNRVFKKFMSLLTTYKNFGLKSNYH